MTKGEIKADANRTTEEDKGGDLNSTMLSNCFLEHIS